MYNSLSILDNSRMYYLDTRDNKFEEKEQKLIDAGYDKSDLGLLIDQATGDRYNDFLFAKSLYTLGGYKNGKYKTFCTGSYEQCLIEKRELFGWC